MGWGLLVARLSGEGVCHYGALIGAPDDDDKGVDAGAAYIFRWDGERWQEEGKLLADAGAQKDYFGQAVSISGEVALVGASEAAYIFRWDGKSW